MTNQEVVKLLAYVRDTIEDDFNDWQQTESNNYLAYGPAHKDALKDLERLLSYFESHAKFEKELSRVYNEGWPDFVDGDIV